MFKSSTADQYLTDLPIVLRDVARATRTNVRTFELAAAAEAAGYRAAPLHALPSGQRGWR